jgi:hypothetical protein
VGIIGEHHLASLEKAEFRAKVLVKAVTSTHNLPIGETIEVRHLSICFTMILTLLKDKVPLRAIS